MSLLALVACRKPSFTSVQSGHKPNQAHLEIAGFDASAAKIPA
jgi:hypothetical protein